MEQITTKEKIIQSAIQLLASAGYTGTSIRKIAQASNIEPSVVYNYFSNKETLLRSARHYINQSLSDGLPLCTDEIYLSEFLRQRLVYQFEHRQEIVALLQYFMHAKDDFPETSSGYVPHRAYQHMRDIIDAGLACGVYNSDSPNDDAKLFTHLINGYLIEYNDRPMSASLIQTIAERIAVFIERALVYQVGPGLASSSVRAEGVS